MKERLGNVLHYIGFIFLIYTIGIGFFVSVDDAPSLENFEIGTFVFYFLAALLVFGFFWGCNYVLTGRTRILPWSEKVSDNIYNIAMGIIAVLFLMNVIGALFMQ